VADEEEAQDPWNLQPSRRKKEQLVEGPLPKSVRIVGPNLVYVEKNGLPPAMLNRLLRLAAFQNPEFYKTQAMRLSTYGKPRVITCGRVRTGTPRDVPEPAAEFYRAYRRREDGPHRLRRHRGHQSLYRKDEVKDFVSEYGQVIIDECHHLSAFTFEQVMRQVKARYVVGLTATPTRKDGHHPIIYMQCGPVRFNMSARTMTETTPFEHKVTPRHTEFRMPPELTEVTIQDIYGALVNDVQRNDRRRHRARRGVRALPVAPDWPDGAPPVFRGETRGHREACLRAQGRYGEEAASFHCSGVGIGARR
jgi:hypothetical protein